MDLLVNHIGYERTGAKYAVASGSEAEVLSPGAVFHLMHCGEAVLSAPAGPRIFVEGWKDRAFYHFDFSILSRPGEYSIRLEDENILQDSSVFTIARELFQGRCISDILFYFKSQRCSWRWNEADKQVPFFGKREGRVDVSGGWYDASGDYSKYLSHLSYANYMNPQQSPLVVWALFELKDSIGKMPGYGGTLLEERALEEGIYGGDFLLRMQDTQGFFYTVVFDQWSKEPHRRMLASFRGKEGLLSADYQAGWRQGGGMAVAALARASRYGVTGDFSPEEYLEGALKGWEHLERHNCEYLDNGRENIIDSYCALIAAVELYKAAGQSRFLAAAEKRARELVELYDKEQGCWFVEKGSTRPFFHAAEAGAPFVFLMEFFSIAGDSPLKSEVKKLVKQGLRDLLDLRGSLFTNPFGLARQWVKAPDSDIKSSFFIPHNNESAYWWQGENARLASLACAARRAAVLFAPEDEGFAQKLGSFATAQINWILGLNPFDVCMLHGQGRNNPAYEKHYPNAPGGICNGITAGFDDERDLDFLPAGFEARGDHRWRWSEQWLPHAAWFLLAISLKERTT